MREILKVLGAIALVVPIALSPYALAAQANPAHTHIGHVTTGFPQTPDGEGLLPTALSEAQAAIQHAGLAAGDLSNLNAMKTHTGHVLHAVAAPEGSSGPGAGFGVKRAAEGIAQHIELAAGADGASAPVRTHANHIAASARTVAQRADEIVALAARIQAADTAAEAAPLVQELQTLTQQLVTGRDATGDGQISWQEGEGGLEQVEQHVGLLTAAEGLD